MEGVQFNLRGNFDFEKLLLSVEFFLDWQTMLRLSGTCKLLRQRRQSPPWQLLYNFKYSAAHPLTLEEILNWDKRVRLWWREPWRPLSSTSVNYLNIVGPDRLNGVPPTYSQTADDWIEAGYPTLTLPLQFGVSTAEAQQQMQHEFHQSSQGDSTTDEETTNEETDSSTEDATDSSMDSMEEERSEENNDTDFVPSTVIEEVHPPRGLHHYHPHTFIPPITYHHMEEEEEWDEDMLAQADKVEQAFHERKRQSMSMFM